MTLTAARRPTGCPGDDAVDTVDQHFELVGSSALGLERRTGPLRAGVAHTSRVGVSESAVRLSGTLQPGSPRISVSRVVEPTWVGAFVLRCSRLLTGSTRCMRSGRWAYSVGVAAGFKLRGGSCRFRTQPAYSLGPDDGEILWFNGALGLLRATADQTEGRFAAFELRPPKGFASPLHSHKSEDEFFLVLSGDVRLQHGDDVVEGVAGSFIYTPRGIGHSFHVDSDDARPSLLRSCWGGRLLP